ncbi:MAG: FtsQ-type POTRA domain-containing protein [Alphaproteobacteria bacterium]|nr:FtsQ-type POTRA domain-containing protein [Alphaproteobacteria bacterium]
MGGSVNEKKKSSSQREQKTPSKFIYFLKFLLKNNLFWWIVFFTGLFCAVFFLKDNFVNNTKNYFSLKKVEFDGHEHVPEVLLLKSSGLRYKNSVFSTPIKEIKERLEKLSWVKSVIVQRKLPGKISVRIAERTPIAILQTKQKLYLVDNDGVVLENDGIGTFSNLPIIVGEGAEKEVDHFLRCIDRFPKIRRQLIFAVRVGKRRWNIRINRGIIVKLPERGLIQAFGILDEISDSNGFFNNDIMYLDLRIPDRVIIGKKNNIESVKD